MSQAHIDIQFVKYSHNDHPSFDGSGSVLAHAYAPEYSDVCFDDSEEWTIRTGSGNKRTLIKICRNDESTHRDEYKFS